MDTSVLWFALIAFIVLGMDFVTGNGLKFIYNLLN